MNSIQSMDALTSKSCQACEGGVEKYTKEQAVAQLKLLGDTWHMNDDGSMISRKWKLKNFVAVMALANRVADLAEQEQHHPDLHVTGYRLLQVDLTTHAIGGLSENDFIVAAKINQMPDL